MVRMSGGKAVAGRRYLHRSLLERTGGALAKQVAAALERLRAHAEPTFDLVRVDAETGEVAFLHYPDFFDDPFPALRESWRVAGASGEIGYRTYADSLNHPSCIARS